MANRIVILVFLFLASCRGFIDYQEIVIDCKRNEVKVLSPSYIIDSISVYSLKMNYYNLTRIGKGSNKLFLIDNMEEYKVSNYLTHITDCNKLYMHVRIKSKDKLEYQFFETVFLPCSDSLFQVRAERSSFP